MDTGDCTRPPDPCPLTMIDTSNLAGFVVQKRLRIRWRACISQRPMAPTVEPHSRVIAYAGHR